MKKINQFKAFLIISAAATILILIALTMRSDANNVVVRTMNEGIALVQRPFVSLTHSVRNFGEGTLDLFDTFEENQRLRAQMYNYHVLNVEADLLREEVESFRTLLEVSETLTDFERIPAMTVGRDIHHWDDFFIVNQGSQNGVDIGMAVLSTEGYLIGKVTEVNHFSARVHLIKTHNQIRPHVMVNGMPESHGILYGYENETGELLVMQVDRDVEVEIGAPVITTGMGGVFPRGLLVGHIVRYELSIDGLTQTLYLENDVNYHRLDFMFIIRREMEAPDL